MAWIEKTNRSGMEYGGSLNRFYWDWSWFGSEVTFDIALANCTVYARGRQFENNRPSPVSPMPQANRWHTAVNTAGGWRLYNYTAGMQLQAGDILEWVDGNHVAVCETSGTSPTVSGSYYTNIDGTAHGSRTPGGAWGTTLQSLCDWMLANYPGRFWHNYNGLTGEIGTYPDYVIRYEGSQPQPTPDLEISISPAVYNSTLPKREDYIDFTFNITITGIPGGETVSGGNTYPGLSRVYNTGWSYSDYEIEGETYRQATKTQTLRYQRESKKAYQITKHMYYDISKSTGEIHTDTRMNITVESQGTVMFLNPEIGSIDIR